MTTRQRVLAAQTIDHVTGEYELDYPAIAPVDGSVFVANGSIGSWSSSVVPSVIYPVNFVGNYRFIENVITNNQSPTLLLEPPNVNLDSNWPNTSDPYQLFVLLAANGNPLNSIIYIYNPDNAINISVFRLDITANQTSIAGPNLITSGSAVPGSFTGFHSFTWAPVNGFAPYMLFTDDEDGRPRVFSWFQDVSTTC